MLPPLLMAFIRPRLARPSPTPRQIERVVLVLRPPQNLLSLRLSHPNVSIHSVRPRSRARAAHSRPAIPLSCPAYDAPWYSLSSRPGLTGYRSAHWNRAPAAQGLG